MRSSSSNGFDDYFLIDYANLGFHGLFLAYCPTTRISRGLEPVGCMPRLDRPSRRREQVPLAGDTFQDMVTAVGEADPGSGDQILHRA